MGSWIRLVPPNGAVEIVGDWLEMTVRSVVRDHGIRDQEDAMSREILAGLQEAGIGVASSTFEIVGLPPLRIEGTAAGRTADGRG